jgi:hypothetical protein
MADPAALLARVQAIVRRLAEPGLIAADVFEIRADLTLLGVLLREAEARERRKRREAQA